MTSDKENSANYSNEKKFLLRELRRIKTIEAPADFSTNFAAYSNLSDREIALLAVWRNLNLQQQDEIFELIASFGKKNE